MLTISILLLSLGLTASEAAPTRGRALSTNPACTECTDVGSPSMEAAGFACDQYSYAYTNRCKHSPHWVNQKYCRRSCFVNGAGYDGDVCCVAETPCTECTDERNSYMEREGLTCDEFPYAYEKLCKYNEYWASQQFCRRSCFVNGAGYQGDVCCTPPPPPPPSPPSTYSTATNTASGHYSTAFGYRTTASGNFSSTALGYHTVASGPTSTAMGDSTTAKGDTAMAMNAQTTASAFASTAMGFGTTASGDHATAMGWDTVASGYSSTAMGFSTVAESWGETVVGRYNARSASSVPYFWATSDAAFRVGIGSSEANRKDAFTVFKNGTVVINGDLAISGSVSRSGSTRRLFASDGGAAKEKVASLEQKIATLEAGAARQRATEQRLAVLEATERKLLERLDGLESAHTRELAAAQQKLEATEQKLAALEAAVAALRQPT